MTHKAFILKVTANKGVESPTVTYVQMDQHLKTTREALVNTRVRQEVFVHTDYRTRPIGSWTGRRRSLGKVLLQEVDEAVGGRVVGGDLGGVLQLRLDLLGKLLPKLHAEGAETKHDGDIISQNTSCNPPP